MKKLRVMRYLAYFVILLIFISVLPEGALSVIDSSEQGNQDQNQYIHENPRSSSDNKTNDETIADNFNSNAEKVQNNFSKKDQNRIFENKQEREQTKEELELQKREYQTAKEEFLKIKSRILARKLDPNSDEALNATKIYLNSSINYMISHLSNVIRSMERSSSNETEEKISAMYEKTKLLESKKAEVVNASSQTELLSTVRSVSEIWNDAQKISLAGSGEIVSKKIGEFLEKSRNLSEKLELNLEKINETGVETSSLETKLTSYNSYLTSAQEKKERADSIYEDENVTLENMEKANNHLRESINDINKANRILRELFDKLKEYEIELTNLTEVESNLKTDSSDTNYTNYVNITTNNSSIISRNNSFVTGDKPSVTGDNPSVTDDNPSVTGDNPSVTDDNPSVTDDNPSVIHITPVN